MTLLITQSKINCSKQIKFNLHKISDTCSEEHSEEFVASHGNVDTGQHHQNEPNW